MCVFTTSASSLQVVVLSVGGLQKLSDVIVFCSF